MVHFTAYRQSVAEAGVSLLELSMVLTIISIIAGSAFISGVAGLNDARRTQTQQKLDRIEKAFASFLALNHYLPCPADQTLAISDPNGGGENCLGLSLTSSTVVGNSHYVTGSFIGGKGVGPLDYNVISGAIPVKALQLPAEFMIDAWGNKFFYAVTGALSQDTGGTGPFQFNRTNMGLIEVDDLTGTKRTDQAAMVVMSYGADEFCSRPRSTAAAHPPTPGGITLPVGPGVAPLGVAPYVAEAVNCGNGTIFVQGVETISQAIVFDDIVRYKMKWQLVREAGGIISEDLPCTTAQTLLNYGADSYCAFGTSDPECSPTLSAMANKVNQLCLQ